MDEETQILKQGEFSNDPEGLEEFLEDVDKALIAIEAGYCWQLLYDRLEEAGYDARLSQPLNVKAIAQAKVKTDQRRLGDPGLHADGPRQAQGVPCRAEDQAEESGSRRARQAWNKARGAAIRQGERGPTSGPGVLAREMFWFYIQTLNGDDLWFQIQDRMHCSNSQIFYLLNLIISRLFIK